MLKKQSGDVVAGWRQSLDTSEAESCDHPEFRFSGGRVDFHDESYLTGSYHFFHLTKSMQKDL